MPKSLSSSAPTGWVDEHTMRAHVWPENPDLLPAYTLRLLCRQRKFPHLKIGRRLFFKLAEVEAYLTQKRVGLEEVQNA
jgi:hypothetical protein